MRGRNVYLMTGDDIEEIRKRKIKELQEQAGEKRKKEEQQKAEIQKDALLRQYLTEGARRRLNTVEMTKPNFAKAAEKQILALAQSGRIKGKIDEEKMKAILKEMKPDNDGFDIKRR